MPQFFIGAGAARWLGALERRMPSTATPPADRPARVSRSSPLGGAAAGKRPR
jgi:hypothetical protein